MTLSPKQRRQRNRQEVIGAILHMARAIMREQGVAALTLNELARRVGMRPPSLYEYFPNKMAIYDRLFLLGVELYEQQTQEVSARYSVPSAHELEERITLHLQFAIDHPELFRLLFERHVPGFVPSDDSMKVMRRVLDQGAARIEQLFANGAPGGLTTQQTQDIVILLMHGLAALHLANDPDAPLGSGRFGSLVPAVVAMLKKSWDIED